MEAFAAFSWQLHEKGVYHIDYSPGNVLIKKEKDRYIFSIVDVNRMKFITFDNDLRFKNLSRFSASLKDTDFIAQKYASLANIDTTYAVEKLRYYHNRHQQYRQRKEKFKVLKKR
jgi:serine/threonine protein kinase